MSFGFLYGLCTLASLGGVVLLIVGLHGRRYGNTPYCRRCGYNLTGLLSERCPECGSALSAEAVVIGEHRRRKGALAFGVMLIIASGVGIGVGVSDVMSRFDPYPYLPFRIVLAEAEADNPAAFAELERRAESGSLRLDQARRAADAALRIQAADPLPRNGQAWINLLDRFCIADLLAPEQQEQYYVQLVRLVPTVRSRVRRGDSLAYQIAYKTRAPADCRSSPYSCRLSYEEVRLGEGIQQQRAAIGANLSGTTGSGSSRGRIETTDTLAPGMHRFEQYLVLEIYEGEFGLSSGSSAQPLVIKRITFSSNVEVLSDNAPDPITVLRDPDVSAQLDNALFLQTILLVPDRYARGPGLDLSFELRKPLPGGLAFAAFIGAAGQENQSDTNVTLTRGAAVGSRWSYAIGSVGDIRPGNMVTVILRASREAVLKTTDLYEYWDGELHFGPLTIPEDTASNLNLPGRVVRREIEEGNPQEASHNRIEVLTTD